MSNGQLATILATVIATGLALGGLFLPELRAMRSDISELRERVTRIETRLQVALSRFEPDSR